MATNSPQKPDSSRSSASPSRSSGSSPTSEARPAPSSPTNPLTDAQTDPSIIAPIDLQTDSLTDLYQDLYVGLPTDLSTDPLAEPVIDTPIKNGKGKEKAISISHNAWADEPWPLIEPLSRTQRITHPAHHIADELTHTHNAMLRGLNSLYIQAPSVRDPVDVADFLFLTQVWSGWVLDYHVMKESAMIPGFEAVLGLERGTLVKRGPGSNIESEDEDSNGVNGDVDRHTNGDNGVEKGEVVEADPETSSQELQTLLQKLHSYAAETHLEPSSYSSSSLRDLLVSLASVLVPHLHNQISILINMQTLCSLPTSTPSMTSLPSLPTLSPSSSPSQPSTSNSIANTISTPLSSKPSTQSRSSPSQSRLPPPPPPLPFLTITPNPTDPTQTLSKFSAAGPLPTPNAAALTQVHLSTETAFNASTDRYTIPPMIVRLRDAIYDGDGGAVAKLTVPAIHAIADRLSPKYAGAWRFLPCDVWGRRLALRVGDEDRGEQGDKNGDEE